MAGGYAVTVGVLELSFVKAPLSIRTRDESLLLFFLLISPVIGENEAGAFWIGCFQVEGWVWGLHFFTLEKLFTGTPECVNIQCMIRATSLVLAC